MRSKDSRFTLGVWGLRVCSLDVAFMFATGPYGRACETSKSDPFCRTYKFCKRGHFWRFHMWCCFGFAWQVWHFVAFRRFLTCFVTCRKPILCGRRSTLDVSIIILRGKHGTLDVSCYVFFANRTVRAASSGNKVIPWQAWHFVIFREMCGKLTEASHETSILGLQIFSF